MKSTETLIAACKELAATVRCDDGVANSALSEIAERLEELSRDSKSHWIRTEFTSVWNGPDIDLIAVQSNGPIESWQWTARGWREPGDCEGADSWGWCEVSTREGAEKSALRFYMEKDE